MFPEEPPEAVLQTAGEVSDRSALRRGPATDTQQVCLKSQLQTSVFLDCAVVERPNKSIYQNVSPSLTTCLCSLTVCPNTDR